MVILWKNRIENLFQKVMLIQKVDEVYLLPSLFSVRVTSLNYRYLISYLIDLIEVNHSIFLQYIIFIKGQKWGTYIIKKKYREKNTVGKAYPGNIFLQLLHLK